MLVGVERVAIDGWAAGICGNGLCRLGGDTPRRSRMSRPSSRCIVTLDERVVITLDVDDLEVGEHRAETVVVSGVDEAGMGVGGGEQHDRAVVVLDSVAPMSSYMRPLMNHSRASRGIGRPGRQRRLDQRREALRTRWAGHLSPIFSMT